MQYNHIQYVYITRVSADVSLEAEQPDVGAAAAVAVFTLLAPSLGRVFSLSRLSTTFPLKL
jgi:hypothetical protein